MSRSVGTDAAVDFGADFGRTAGDYADFRPGLPDSFFDRLAESIGLAPASVDLALASPCWHGFDRPRAASELRRILRPGAALVIAHLDWLPGAGSVVARTEELILSYNPTWPLAGGNGLYPQWQRDVADVGFEDLTTFAYDLDIGFTHAAWRGRIRASAGVGASLPPADVERFDRDLAVLLQREFGAEPMGVRHRVWALLATAP